MILEFLFVLLEIMVGGFFAISGFHKLLLKQRHKTLVETLKADRVPFRHVAEWVIPVVELVGGVLLATGYVEFYAAGALLAISVGACLYDAPTRVKAMKPINWLDYIDCWLYLCETWLVVILLLIMVLNTEDVKWMMQLL